MLLKPKNVNRNNLAEKREGPRRVTYLCGSAPSNGCLSWGELGARFPMSPGVLRRSLGALLTFLATPRKGIWEHPNKELRAEPPVSSVMEKGCMSITSRIST